jgi:MerR family transcriptional regulator, light-induced transcriptional regulator
MASQTPEALFPIRELVRRTGVNASTLRAWENRHGLLTPTRMPSGHRLYGEADIRRIQRIQDLLAQGLSLGELAPLLAKATGNSTPASTPVSTPDSLPVSSGGTVPHTAWDGYLVETLKALEDFSTERLDALYSEACAVYPIDIVTDNLLIPMLEQIGERWNRRPSGIAEEHFFSAWLRNKLGARLHHAGSLGQGPQLILACLPYENHEIGLLMFALLALQRGYRVIYLGANMPIRQIVHVALHTRAQAIVLAGRQAENPRELLADIEWLAQAAETPVFVGSHFAEQFRLRLEQGGAIPMGDNMGLAIRLLEIRLREWSKNRSRI